MYPQCKNADSNIEYLLTQTQPRDDWHCAKNEQLTVTALPTSFMTNWHLCTIFTGQFRPILKHMGKRIVYFSWQSDITMGRQILTGITPTSFSQCREIPDYFDVTNDDVSELLGKGKCLNTEMEVGVFLLFNVGNR